MHAADDITVLRNGKNVGTVKADETSRGTRRDDGRSGGTAGLDRDPAEPGRTIREDSDLVVEDDRGVRAVDGSR